MVIGLFGWGVGFRQEGYGPIVIMSTQPTQLLADTKQSGNGRENHRIMLAPLPTNQEFAGILFSRCFGFFLKMF